MFLWYTGCRLFTGVPMLPHPFLSPAVTIVELVCVRKMQGGEVMAINIRRVVTGHDDNGKAMVRIDDVGAHVARPTAYVAAAHLDDR